MKTLMIASRSFIILSAASILYVCVMAFINPQAVMDLVNVQLTNNDAISSIRGVYGGVSLVIVISLIYMLIFDVQKALSFLTMLWGFYALSRLITIAADGSLGAFGTQWLATESVFFIIALCLLILLQRKVKTKTVHY